MPNSTNLLGVIVLTHWDDTVVQVMPQTAGYLHRLTAAYVCLYVSQARPTLQVTGAEYDEDDSAQNLNSGGQIEDFLPLGAC